MAKRLGKNVVGIIVCAGVSLAAPMVGVGVTVLLLPRAFQHTADVEPSIKARVLAEGISSAMNGAACGLIVSLVAAAAAIVFIVRLLRERRAP